MLSDDDISYFSFVGDQFVIDSWKPFGGLLYRYGNMRNCKPGTFVLTHDDKAIRSFDTVESLGLPYGMIELKRKDTNYNLTM